MSEMSVLRGKFDIETHKATFTNYLEVVILEDGIVEYAVPSHQEKLIKVACEKLGISRDELNRMCPKEYYFDFMTWLCMISKCVALWSTQAVGTPNEIQRKTIQMLAREELYEGSIG